MDKPLDGSTNCTDDNNDGTECPDTLLNHLCLRLKPPDFPVWFQADDIQQLRESCNSWKTYTELCLGEIETTTATQEENFSAIDVTTDSSVTNVTDIDINTTESLYDESILSTVLSPTSLSLTSPVSTDVTTPPDVTVTDDVVLVNVTEELSTGNLSEYLININTTFTPQSSKSENVSYTGRNVSYQGRNWIATGVAFSLATLIIIGAIVVYKLYRKYSCKYCLDTQMYIDYNYLHRKAKKKEKWKNGKNSKTLDIEKSVMFVPNDNEIFISENHKLGDISPLSNNQIIDLQHQSFGEDPLYVLPNTLPEVNVNISKDTFCEQSFTEELDQDFNLPPLSLSTTGFKGTLETGFINPAYEGTESIIDASLPRKKKKRRFPFLKILRKSKRDK
ncbi:uncharacterized protein LOC126821881 [Patella vulgata]|uniref:uncharacterized protein LOC126821881 n=1 Tax=Patella vulgata TaxID=6465 RepID=UPI00217FC5CE|nr:uncharacterized protein LOC126821881 [Patella vulgata]XP_050406421.1 uncharacterized protein LOC126821881 [Patella vulgata]XP_050406422.1 uncharacterized protein LOC126821881 [Patella vulgata]XP_050406423.1 uncharacterized protein LOC126821881 [Patella vulgata]